MASTFSCIAFLFVESIFSCMAFSLVACDRPLDLYFSLFYLSLNSHMILLSVRFASNVVRSPVPPDRRIPRRPVPFCLPASSGSGSGFAYRPVSSSGLHTGQFPNLLTGPVSGFAYRPVSGFVYRPVSGFREFGHHHPSRQSGQSALRTNDK